jgi:hypothetical protein
MFSDHLAIGLRNLLMLQLLVAVLAPERVIALNRNITRIWRSFLAPLRARKCRPAGKSFWEIDMTKFEP